MAYGFGCQCVSKAVESCGRIVRYVNHVFSVNCQCVMFGLASMF